jgi:hypothetical protein
MEVPQRYQPISKRSEWNRIEIVRNIGHYDILVLLTELPNAVLEFGPQFEPGIRKGKIYIEHRGRSMAPTIVSLIRRLAIKNDTLYGLRKSLEKDRVARRRNYNPPGDTKTLFHPNYLRLSRAIGIVHHLIVQPPNDRIEPPMDIQVVVKICDRLVSEAVANSILPSGFQALVSQDLGERLTTQSPAGCLRHMSPPG